MNIKEAETQTGITKQNIRFYERKGLLAPQRNLENSYREYSKDDIERLLQIKMHRKLDVPIEHIQRIFNGENQNEILKQHLDNLVEQKKHLEDAITICRFILRTKEEPADTQTVLLKMEELEQKGGHFMAIINDYKKISDIEKKDHFQFRPDFLVQTPQDFTKALCEYGMDHNLNLVVTKEGMYPNFEIDGMEYEAFRQVNGYGSVIFCKAKDSNMLNEAYTDMKPKWRTVLYRIISHLTVPVFLLIMLIGANFWIAVTAFLFFLCLEIACGIKFRKNKH